MYRHDSFSHEKEKTVHGLVTNRVNLPGRHARSCVPARAGRPVLLPPISEELIMINSTLHPVTAFGNVFSYK